MTTTSHPHFLVTGGAGFIGSHIVDHLLELGHTVRVVDNLSTGKRENMAGFIDRIDFIEGDLCDPAVCAQACDGVDYVLHQAAIPSVPRSIADPVGTTRNNVMSTVTLLDAAARAGVKRLVYASSCAVYGDDPTPVKHEGLLPRPLSPYAAVKVAGEQLCRTFAMTTGLDTVSLRYFNVYGPRQDPNGDYAAVIPKFIALALAGKPLTVYGDGTQTRDFIYVTDVAAANVKAALFPESLRGGVFNVASGRSVSLLELVDAIREIMSHRVTVIKLPAVVGDVQDSRADMLLAANLVPMDSVVDLHHGLAYSTLAHNSPVLA